MRCMGGFLPTFVQSAASKRLAQAEFAIIFGEVSMGPFQAVAASNAANSTAAPKELATPNLVRCTHAARRSIPFDVSPPQGNCMAKPLVFQFGGKEVSFQMNKVDRSKLYGFKELEVLDEKKRPCELATLSGDGQTVVGRGGTGLAYNSSDGLWCNKGELTPVDIEGNEIEPVKSSFNAPNPLGEEVSIDRACCTTC